MKSNIILATLCVGFLSSGAVYGHHCPSIPKNWDGKTLEASGPLTWSVGKMTSNLNLAKVSWQPHQAWIFTKTKKKQEKNGYFKCIYKAVDDDTKKVVGRLMIITPNTPDLEKLAAASEFKGEKEGATKKTATVENGYANKDETITGAKCVPIKGDLKTLNTFPSACDIISKPKK